MRKRYLILSWFLCIFFNSDGQGDIPFPKLKDKNRNCCRELPSNKMSSFQEHHFDINRDSILIDGANKYYLIESDFFYPETFIGLIDENIFIINASPIWNEKLKSSLLFDFNPASSSWKLSDSTRYHDYAIKYLGRDYDPTSRDTIYRFNMTSQRAKISDSSELTMLFVSKNYGLLGLEYTLNAKVNRICYSERIKRFIKKRY